MLKAQWQRNLFGVLIAAFVSILGFNLVFPFLPLYIQTLGSYTNEEAAFWTGILGLVTGLVGAFAALVWGQLADRRGRKPMIIRATAGAAFGLAGMGLAQNLWQLLAARTAFSALSGTVPASNPLIAANTPTEHLSRAMGMLQSSVYLSNTLGPLIGGLLADAAGFRAAFLVTAGLYLASAIPPWLLVKERFVPQPQSRPLLAAVSSDLISVLRDPPIAWPILAQLIAQIGANVAMTVMSLLIRDLVGAGAAERAAGVAYFGQGLTSAVSAMFIGRLVGRIGHRGLLRITAPAAVALYLGLWWAPGYPWLVLFLALLGGVQGLQVPAMTALIAQRAPRERVGRVFGVVSSINSIAFSGGPFIAGMLARSFGLRSVFPVSAALLVLLILVTNRATAGPVEAASAPTSARN